MKENGLLEIIAEHRTGRALDELELTEDCYPYRKELKALGFRWASQKQMWYKHFDDFHKFSSKPASMSYIRAKYGSVEIKFKEKQKEREKLTKA